MSEGWHAGDGSASAAAVICWVCTTVGAWVQPLAGAVVDVVVLVDVVVDVEVEVDVDVDVDVEVDEVLVVDDVVDAALCDLLWLVVSTSRMTRTTSATPRPITTPSRMRLSPPPGGRGRPGGRPPGGRPPGGYPPPGTPGPPP